jgi:hypothetical protein
MEHRRAGVNGTKDPVPRVSLTTYFHRKRASRLGADEARGEAKYRTRSSKLKLAYSTEMDRLRRQENANYWVFRSIYDRR